MHLEDVKETQKRKRHNKEKADAERLCLETAIALRRKWDERKIDSEEATTALCDKLEEDRSRISNYLAGNPSNLLRVEALNELSKKIQDSSDMVVD